MMRTSHGRTGLEALRAAIDTMLREAGDAEAGAFGNGSPEAQPDAPFTAGAQDVWSCALELSMSRDLDALLHRLDATVFSERMAMEDLLRRLAAAA
jgi:hypothetical protein